MNNENQTNEKDVCLICKTKYYTYGEDGICKDCDLKVETIIGTRSVLNHFWIALVCFFNFNFFASLGSLTWAVERLFKIGDYNVKTGYWYTSGILKDN
jgi:hypothetical protein